MKASVCTKRLSYGRDFDWVFVSYRRKSSKICRIKYPTAIYFRGRAIQVDRSGGAELNPVAMRRHRVMPALLSAQQIQLYMCNRRTDSRKEVAEVNALFHAAKDSYRCERAGENR